MTSDGLKMFLQFNLSQSTQAQMQIVTLNSDSSDLQWWKQKSMPMGGTPSSGVAERHLLMELVFNKAEQQQLTKDAQDNPTFQEFVEKRQSLTKQTGRNQSVL